MRTPHFWLLGAVYMFTGLGSFLVALHQLAFAVDIGFDKLREHLRPTYRAHRTTLTSRLENIPTVAVDRPIAGFKSDCVMINNHNAAYDATR